jgi:FkbM family methyltransferase
VDEKPLAGLRYAARRLPGPVRRTLGYGRDYSARLLRWISILRSIRGNTIRDQLRLLASAIASPLTSLGRPGQWQDPVLLWDVDVRVEGIGLFALRSHTDDLWHVFPGREPAVLRGIHDHLDTGDVFVDAGANIGVYTVLAARLVGTGGRVIAIEMLPETASILRGHLLMNHLENVSVFENALAGSPGEQVVAKVPAGQYGQATITTSATIGAGQMVKVETSTLDVILAETDKVALMKMDLEGAEEAALSGAENTLQRIRAVIFEDHGASRLSEVFCGVGLRVQRLDGNNCLATELTAK